MNFMTSMKNFGARAKFVAQKNAPQICLIGGIISFGATIVAACKATVKAADVLDAYNEHKEQIEEALEASKKADETPELSDEAREKMHYTEEDAKKERIVAMKELGVGMAKKFWPVALLAAISLTCFLSAYKITSGRLTAAVGAYTALDEGFRRYRERTKEVVGEEKEEEIRTGIHKEKGYVKETTPEGEEVVNEKEVNTKSSWDKYDNGYGDVIWNEVTAPYEYHINDPVHNEAWLRGQQTYFNNLVQTRGYILEYEMRQWLGLPVTDRCVKMGLGIIKDPANPHLNIDTNPYVDLHIRPVNRETGEMLLYKGKLVKEVKNAAFAITFDTKPIGDFIHLWEAKTIR